MFTRLGKGDFMMEFHYHFFKTDVITFSKQTCREKMPNLNFTWLWSHCPDVQKVWTFHMMCMDYFMTSNVCYYTVVYSNSTMHNNTLSIQHQLKVWANSDIMTDDWPIYKIECAKFHLLLYSLLFCRCSGNCCFFQCVCAVE